MCVCTTLHPWRTIIFIFGPKRVHLIYLAPNIKLQVQVQVKIISELFTFTVYLTYLPGSS